MLVSFLRRLAPAAALLAAGCASTTVDGSWVRPDAPVQRIEGPVLVVGVTRDETVRRIYEDAMVARLAARGVQATQSYVVVPGDLGSDSPGPLLQQARGSGARYLLSTAVLAQQLEATVFQDPWPNVGFVGYRGWYGAYWGMAWPVYTQVRTFPVIIAQTALTRVDADRIDWVVRTRTTAPGSVDSETRAFVDVILAAMSKDGLVAAAP